MRGAVCNTKVKCGLKKVKKQKDQLLVSIEMS